MSKSYLIMNLVLREHYTNLNLLISAVILLVFFAFINRTSSKAFSYLIIGFFIKKYFNLAKQINYKNKQAQITILLGFLFVICLFIASLFSINNIFLIGKISILTCTFFICKIFTLKISGYIFEKKEIFNEFYNYYIYFIKSVGLICLPVLIINSIYPIQELNINNFYNINIILFFIICLLFLLKIIQSIKIARLNNILTYQYCGYSL